MSSTSRTGKHWWSRRAPRDVGEAALVLLGLAAWIVYLAAGHDAARGWRALLINFLYFTPMAGGLVTWSAVVRASHGQWMGPLERTTSAGLAFAPLSVVALTLLWITSPWWAPWYGKDLPQGAWLNNTFLFVRDLVGLVVFWIVAGLYVRWRLGPGTYASGPVLIVLYSVVFSLLGFDLGMAMDPKWSSSLYGGYFFVSGIYIAIAAWTFTSVWRQQVSPERLSDLGKLIVAFCMLTAYLMYSQLLPYWYENIPEETEYLVPRMNYQPWLSVSYVLLGVVYLGPIALLLPRWSKRTPGYLGFIALLILAGMWLERWWLIVPRRERSWQLGLPELGMLAVFLGACAFTWDWTMRRLPEQLPQPEGGK